MKTYGGFDVAALFILNIVLSYPQHTFYYIGSNDISSMSNIPSNLIDIETPIRELKKDSTKEKYEVAVEYCKQYKFDLAIYWYCSRCTHIIGYSL